MSIELLDNVIWHALTGPQAEYAAGSGAARRYAPGFSAILGFADPARPDFAALDAWCEPGEHFYCSEWSGPVPAGWQLDGEGRILQMTWDAAAPAAEALPDAVPLGPAHVAQMLALATLTQPGPFGPRTVELGEYFGIFEGPRLVAMAGERMAAGRLREVSGVCTHPDFQGRGWARRLIEKLVWRQLRRGQLPFLHVMGHNPHAAGLYQRMGFRLQRETVVRQLTRCA